MTSDTFVHDTYIHLESPLIARIVVCLVATILIAVYIAYVDDPATMRGMDSRPAGKRGLSFSLKQLFIAVAVAAAIAAIAILLMYILYATAACW